MALDPTTARVPTSIGRVRIVFEIPRDGSGADASADYMFEVLDADGEVIMPRRAGNLVPHLSGTEKTNVAAFLDNQKAKAEGTLP